jgi:hypothetical protein
MEGDDQFAHAHRRRRLRQGDGKFAAAFAAPPQLQAAAPVERALVVGIEGGVLEAIMVQHAGDALAHRQVPEQVIAVAEVVEQVGGQVGGAAVVGRRGKVITDKVELAKPQVRAVEQQHAQAARDRQRPGGAV